MADKMIVTGLGKPWDGEYEFDMVGMLTLGHPDCLTNREGHRVKSMTKLRMGEFTDAMLAGDSDVYVALAAVVLTRAGKPIDDELLWDAPIGSGIQIVPDKTAPVEGDARPPEQPLSDDEPKPNVDDPKSPTETQTASGGGSSSQSSDSPNGNDPSPTGAPLSETHSLGPASASLRSVI